LTEVSSNIVSLKIDTSADKPFIIEAGKLVMQTKPNYWNSYLTEFSTANLEKNLRSL